jgi:hypothetical protein
MSRFLLALRCFFAVLFYYRLPKGAAALLPPPDLSALPPLELAPAVVERSPEDDRRFTENDKRFTENDKRFTENDKRFTEKGEGLSENVKPLSETVQEPAPAPAAPAAAPDDVRRRGAVQMLALLQREGRLIDFLMEDVDGYADAQIGAAARDIHRGCRKGLLEHVKVAPVRPEPDEAAVRVEDGYDPSAVRLIGNITGRPPFHGTLRHHGWRAKDVLLPDLPASHDPHVITPAEVELDG